MTTAGSHWLHGRWKAAHCVTFAAYSHVYVLRKLYRLPDMLATCCPWLHALPDATPNACMHMDAWERSSPPAIARL